MDIQIRGLNELQADLKRIAEELPKAIAWATSSVIMDMTADARRNAPIDRGVLRSSIMPKVTEGPRTIKGVVGSNRKYTQWQEEGTEPFRANWSAIEAWAKRKGIEHAFLVWRAIATRGIRAKHFLLDAFNSHKDDAFKRILNAVDEVINR